MSLVRQIRQRGSKMGCVDTAGYAGSNLTDLGVFFAEKCVDAIEADSDEKLRQAEAAWQRARGKITNTDKRNGK